MSRTLRTDTLERVLAARHAKPLHIGAFFGELCIRAGITANQIAQMIGAHEQTVFRWFVGQTQVQPVWSGKVGHLVMFVSWLHHTGRAPLKGSPRERTQLIIAHVHEFKSLARREQKVAA